MLNEYPGEREQEDQEKERDKGRGADTSEISHFETLDRRFLEGFSDSMVVNLALNASGTHTNRRAAAIPNYRICFGPPVVPNMEIKIN